VTTPALERKATRTKAREYSGPLGILAAGAIGLSLLCSVSAMAMGDLSRYVPITLEPLNIVDLAVANFQTAAALTEQVVTVFVPTQTLVPTNTDSPPSLTPSLTDTPRRFVTITPTLPRRTRVPFTATLAPSRTPTRRPPTATRTPVPTTTRTLVPPTFTPSNTPTDLPPPTDTNTVPPPPTDTDTPQPPPPATDTPVPPTNTQQALPTQGSTQAPTSANPAIMPSPTPGP